MANFNFNKVIIGGRLTADPELKTTQSGLPVTTFSVAVSRRGKDAENKADFFNVTAWRQTAEFVTKFFHKGSSICIVGTLQNRSWEGTDGKKHTVTEIQADEALFVDSKSEASPSPVPPVVTAYQATAATAPKFEQLADDDPLPF